MQQHNYLKIFIIANQGSISFHYFCKEIFDYALKTYAVTSMLADSGGLW